MDDRGTSSSVNMSISLPPPPASPDFSSPSSPYRPFSHLPFELVQAIIEAAVPHLYNSTSYTIRQATLRSLCLVSRLFREVAQPPLFAVARYTSRLYRAAWDQRYCRDCDEAFPAEDLVFLRFDFVVPALTALSVEYSGIRSLTIWEFKGSLDLADLSPLSNLQTLRLASLTLSQSGRLFLPKLAVMQLLWVNNAERIMLPESLPSLRALLYSSQGRPAPQNFSLALAGIAPQLEMLSLDLDIISKLPEDFVRTVNSLTLFDVTVEAAELPEGRNVRLILDRNDLEAVDVLEDLAHNLSWRPSSSAPKLLYLPLSSLDNPTSSDRFEFALYRLSLACQKKNVEVDEEAKGWIVLMKDRHLNSTSGVETPTGVALNLVEASRVVLLDPWWNPAVELQAMDRCHRLGQHRPIKVTRLVIENSIESRILELQKKKENLAASALGDDDKAMGRLSPEDLAFLFSL